MSDAASKRSQILIFCRVPGCEPVKTRLAESMGAAWASSLYQACLLDLIEEALAAAGAEVALCYSPSDAGEHLLRWLDDPPGVGLDRTTATDRLTSRPQSGADLGERMASALECSFEEGFGRTLLIGSDTPGLGADDITADLEQLARDAIIFGPAIDGGFYLVGGRCVNLPEARHQERESAGGCCGDVFRALFRGVSWSEADTLAQVLKRAGELGLSPALAAPRPDLDRASDIPIVLQTLTTGRAAGHTAAARLLPLLERWKQGAPAPPNKL